ncbi:hypothetical protein BV20DRAFT_807095 [Pilatotrama ljubarskyi]|nr:hypothetical protein BV20DRAFT_807095 [Pilatotrama ljubarskyi]
MAMTSGVLYTLHRFMYGHVVTTWPGTTYHNPSHQPYSTVRLCRIDLDHFSSS